MKVTALLPDDLVQEVQERAGGRNLTECLVIGLKEWIALKNIRRLNQQIAARPLRFRQGFSASQARKQNRIHDPR